jgi:hypothetical protein
MTNTVDEEVPPARLPENAGVDVFNRNLED